VSVEVSVAHRTQKLSIAEAEHPTVTRREAIAEFVNGPERILHWGTTLDLGGNLMAISDDAKWLHAEMIRIEQHGPTKRRTSSDASVPFWP
jgi:hypothetical protein